jgi:hypothetical protein
MIEVTMNLMRDSEAPASAISLFNAPYLMATCIDTFSILEEFLNVSNTARWLLPRLAFFIIKLLLIAKLLY